MTEFLSVAQALAPVMQRLELPRQRYRRLRATVRNGEKDCVIIRARSADSIGIDVGRIIGFIHKHCVNRNKRNISDADFHNHINGRWAMIMARLPEYRKHYADLIEKHRAERLAENTRRLP